MTASELKRVIEVRDALFTENKKLVEENAKMTKRKAKLECKLNSAIRRSESILIEVSQVVKFYEEKGTYKFKKFKQIIKNHSK